MEIEFFGAARQVTGSLTLLRAAGRTIMIDCGLRQGDDDDDSLRDLPPGAAKADCLILTHAHIDHSGKIPLLYKLGFKGKVHCTGATADLCQIMLMDSAYIQESEAEWKSRKSLRAGRGPVEPLYTSEDAAKALESFSSHDYDEVYDLYPGIRIRFVDAGHLLGSASVEIWVFEDDKTTKLVFSGDIGNTDQPIINDPGRILDADAVVMESTYGDRLHKRKAPSTAAMAGELRQIVEDAFARGGNVIMPTFSVGRTQEILYLFRHLYYEEGFRVPVFVDSPLSVKATGVFSRNILGYFDEEAMAAFDEGLNPIAFPTLVPITAAADSKSLNSRRESAVIISSSGMCEAGRIRHHLKHNLYRSESAVVFTGYQAPGTLGAKILAGPPSVRIFGEEIAVRARIVRFEGLSGHADKNGLINWLGAFNPRPKRVFVVHGEEEVSESFARTLRSLGYKAACPRPGEVCPIDL